MFSAHSMNGATKFNKPFETLIRKDTPEIMVDKLAIID
tara:strand:+ start:406 stop:519 length:114 start_codon:yes stop_codon:yes gene_type:complete